MIYANHGMIITDGARVTFGDHVFVAPGNVVAAGVPCRVMREISEADKTRYPVYALPRNP